MTVAVVEDSTANLDGGREFEKIRLLKKDVSGSTTKLLDLILRKLNLLAGSRWSDLCQPSDYIIHYRKVHRNLTLRRHWIFSDPPPPPPPPFERLRFQETLERGWVWFGLVWLVLGPFVFFLLFSPSQRLRLYFFLCCGLFWWVYKNKKKYFVFSGKKRNRILFFINLFMLLRLERERDGSVKLKNIEDRDGC